MTLTKFLSRPRRIAITIAATTTKTRMKVAWIAVRSASQRFVLLIMFSFLLIVVQSSVCPVAANASINGGDNGVMLRKGVLVSLHAMRSLVVRRPYFRLPSWRPDWTILLRRRSLRTMTASHRQFSVSPRHQGPHRCVCLNLCENFSFVVP